MLTNWETVYTSIPSDLKRRIVAAAKNENRSLAGWIREALSDYVEAVEAGRNDPS